MAQSPWYYRVAISAIKPLYRLGLVFRSGAKKPTPEEIAQRFGHKFPAIHSSKPIIWCHAVSLGETNTVAPILHALAQQGYALWITNTTHTGYNRVSELFSEQIQQGEVYQSFVPVDDTGVISRFLQHVQPVGALFVETELWANTLAMLAQNHIPSMLINGRLSEKSFTGYQRYRSLSQSMMDNLSLIIAQDSDSAKRFRSLGAGSDKIRIAQSLKWSSQTNPIMLAKAKQFISQQALTNRTIIVASSTHQGEEQMVLESFTTLQAQFAEKNLLLILVPRHPERFDEVAGCIEKSGMNFIKRSTNQPITADTPVFLADSMGELGMWYALADIAIVGGSLVNIGGHNPIEAAIVGKPIIMGQYTQSCQQVVDKLKNVGALQQVPDKAGLTQAVRDWLNDMPKAQQAGQAGLILAEQHQNAMQQQLDMILTVLKHNQS